MTQPSSDPITPDLTTGDAEPASKPARLRQSEALRRIERDIALTLSAASDLATGLQEMLTQILRIDGIDCGGVYLVDPESGALDLMAHQGLPPEFVADVTHFGPETDQARLYAEGHLVFTPAPDAVGDRSRQNRKAAGIRTAAAIPIHHQGRAIAGLNLGSTRLTSFPPAIREVMRGIQVHLGAAIARLQAEASWRETEEALRNREHFLDTLNQMTRTALTASSSKEMFQRLTDELDLLFQASNCYLVLWDEVRGRPIPTAATGEWRDSYEAFEVTTDEPTLTEAVLAAGKPLTVGCNHSTALVSSRISQQFPAESILALPLIAADRKLGAILIAFAESHTFLRQEIANGEQVAGQIALALYKTRLLEEVQIRWQEAETLREAALAVTTTLARDQVIERILAQLQEVVAYDTASVQLLDGDQLEIVGGYGYPNLPDIVGLTFDIRRDDNPNHHVIRNRSTYIVEDGPARYAEFRAEPHALAGIRGWMGVPMMVGDRLTGMIALDKKVPGFYTEHHARLAEGFAAQAAVAIENSLLFERAQAELAERKRTEKALQASEEIYRSLVEQSQDAIFLSQDDELILLNPSGEALFGTTLEEIHTTESSLADYIVPRDRERVQAQIESYLRGNLPSPRFEFTIRSADGRELEVEAVVSRVQLARGTAIQGIIRDLTARKQIEQRLREQEQLAALGQLSAGLAHELRNRLSSILLYAELDLRRRDLPERVAQHLRTIISESRAAAELTQQILDFSSNAVLQRRVLDLAELAHRVHDELQGKLPSGIELVLETGSDDYLIEADADRIEQALRNIVDNSRDAMPDGGTIRCTIDQLTVDTDSPPPLAELGPGTWVCLSVTDAGVGMSEAVRTHIFEPFFTTKEVGEGRGLGMPQVYGIVRQHQGVVDVETSLGAGTTVRLYFPAYAPA